MATSTNPVQGLLEALFPSSSSSVKETEIASLQRESAILSVPDYILYAPMP